MPTIFEKIIAGDIPSYKIYEDDYVYAFLDIHPIVLWHTLIVSKCPVEYFVDVPEPYYTAVFQAAKKIAPAIQQATQCTKIATLIMWYGVPHFHYHLVPTNSEKDIDPSKAHTQSPEAMQAMQQQILQNLQK